MSIPVPRRLFLILSLVVCTALPAQAQSDLTGFNFLQLEPSARAAALGGAFSAVYGNDLNAMFYNPALLNQDMHGAFSVSYLNHLSDLNAGFLAYSRHVDGIATSFGAGLRFLSWGEIERADENGERNGTFGASDFALTIGGARKASEKFHYGLNIHLVYSSIDAFHASALATDLGVLYHDAPSRFTLSASIHNLGGTLSSFGDTRDELPVDLRLGLTKRLKYLPLMITLMAYDLNNLGAAPDGASALDNVFYHLNLGGEFQFSEAFNLRFGYNHRQHDNLKMKSRLDFAGFGIGVGIKISRINVDYAFNSWSSAGGLHQFTLRTVF